MLATWNGLTDAEKDNFSDKIKALWKDEYGQLEKWNRPWEWASGFRKFLPLDIYTIDKLVEAYVREYKHIWLELGKFKSDYNETFCTECKLWRVTVEPNPRHCPVCGYAIWMTR